MRLLAQFFQSSPFTGVFKRPLLVLELPPDESVHGHMDLLIVHPHLLVRGTPDALDFVCQRIDAALSILQFPVHDVVGLVLGRCGLLVQDDRIGETRDLAALFDDDDAGDNEKHRLQYPDHLFPSLSAVEAMQRPIAPLRLVRQTFRSRSSTFSSDRRRLMPSRTNLPPGPFSCCLRLLMGIV